LRGREPITRYELCPREPGLHLFSISSVVRWLGSSFGILRFGPDLGEYQKQTCQQAVPAAG